MSDKIDEWLTRAETILEKQKQTELEFIEQQAATIAQLQRELKDTRDELEVYRLASETAVYEASQFDRGLFLSGDRGVEDVMRRVLEALKVARSEATQAKAQAAFVAAERDGLKARLSDAQMEASQATEGYEYERQARILAMQQRDERAKERDAARQERDGLLQLLAARPMHPEDEAALARASEKAKALFKESKTPR